LSSSESSTTSKSAEGNDTNDDTSNGRCSNGSNGNDWRRDRGTVSSLIATVTDAVTSGIGSSVGRRSSRDRKRDVLASAVTSAVVRAGLRDEDSGDKAGSKVDLGRSTISVLRALTIGKGASRTSSLAGAPSAVKSVGTRGFLASLAVSNSREILALLHLSDGNIASGTSPVGGEIGANSAIALVGISVASTMAAAELTIVVALKRNRSKRTAICAGVKRV